MRKVCDLNRKEKYTLEDDSQFAENAEIVDEEGNSENFDEKRKLLNQTKIAKQTWSILEIYQKMFFLSPRMPKQIQDRKCIFTAPPVPFISLFSLLTTCSVPARKCLHTVLHYP